MSRNLLSAAGRRLLLPAALVTGLVLAACGSGPKAPMNILLVTVDTLRADHLHCYGYPLDISPNVDALARRGLRYELGVAQASFTVPSLASLMTGRNAAEFGVASNGTPMPRNLATLAVVLRQGGFRTAGFVSNYALRPRMRFNLGFEHYDAEFSHGELNRPALRTRDARRTSDAVIAWLRKNADADAPPFFAWVHYHDPHGPYSPPDAYVPSIDNYPRQILPALTHNVAKDGIPNYQLIGEERDAAEYRARYDGEIRFFDHHFGRLVNFIEERGLLENTAILLTSDHGESMGEHEFWFAHGQDLFNELLRVPLILSLPGIKPGVRDSPAALIDLYPTILAMAGLTTPLPANAASRNLLVDETTVVDRPIYSEINNDTARSYLRSVIVDRWKLISSPRPGVLPRLYDLEADPAERHNLYDAIAESEPGLIRSLEDHIATAQARGLARGRGEDLELSTGEIDALKALGYIENQSD